jgi:hypothetical protein
MDNRHYTVTEFSDFFPQKRKLNDIMISYNDGIKWKIIPLSIMNIYPIIYDEYNETNEQKRTITIYVCPYTLFSCVYFGKYTLSDKTENNNLSIVDVENDIYIIPILNKTYSLTTNELLDKYIKKGEVRITTLKNVLYLFPDCLFVNTSKIPHMDAITNKDYLQNKQIIYIIEYKSKNHNHTEYKYTIIKPKINSFDIVKNGFESYFHKMVEQIRIKGGVIYPCLLDEWTKTNIESKKIEL